MGGFWFSKKEVWKGHMTTVRRYALILTLLCSAAHADEDVVHAIHGTIQKIDQDTKTVVVKTGDGIEHSLRVTDGIVVHSSKSADKAATASWHELRAGAEVVAHYTQRGTEDSAVEIDKLGEDGLKATAGRVAELDRGAKRLVVDTVKSGKETFRLTSHAAEDAGKDVAKETEKGAKVTIYYTDDGGDKVAHFFEGR